MNKSQIKKLISKQVQIIATSAQDMAISRWKRAKAFSEIHSMIVWDKSPYKTFRAFIAEEFPETNQESALLWVVNYNQMNKLYTWTQIQLMAKSIAYSKAVGMQQNYMSKGIKKSITQFIKSAKTFKRPQSVRAASVPNPNRVSLILPTLYLEKFENTLVPFGYSIPKDRNDPKHGISDALIKYLDTI